MLLHRNINMLVKKVALIILKDSCQVWEIWLGVEAHKMTRIMRNTSENGSFCKSRKLMNFLLWIFFKSPSCLLSQIVVHMTHLPLKWNKTNLASMIDCRNTSWSNVCVCVYIYIYYSLAYTWISFYVPFSFVISERS